MYRQGRIFFLLNWFYLGKGGGLFLNVWYFCVEKVNELRVGVIVDRWV